LIAFVFGVARVAGLAGGSTRPISRQALLTYRDTGSRVANFPVRICHLSHLKSPNELSLLDFFLQRGRPLSFNNGEVG
jgi:hypothetical protein